MFVIIFVFFFMGVDGFCYWYPIYGIGIKYEYKGLINKLYNVTYDKHYMSIIHLWYIYYHMNWRDRYSCNHWCYMETVKRGWNLVATMKPFLKISLLSFLTSHLFKHASIFFYILTRTLGFFILGKKYLGYVLNSVLHLTLSAFIFLCCIICCLFWRNTWVQV